MKEPEKRIGELLVMAGAIDEMQLSAALGEQNRWGGKLCSIIVRRGYGREENIAAALEEQLGKKCIALKKREIPAEILAKVKPEIARKYNIVPVGAYGRTLDIATSDPADLKTIDELSFLLGVRIRPFLAIESGLKECLERSYGGREKVKPIKITIDNAPPPFQGEPPPMNPEAGEVKSTAEVRMEALIRVLSKKGLVTEAELMEELNQ